MPSKTAIELGGNCFASGESVASGITELYQLRSAATDEDAIKICYESDQLPRFTTETIEERNGSTQVAFGGLLFHQAGVAGHTLPAALGKDPGIGEAPDVLVRLALVRSFGPVDPDNDRRVSVHAYFGILDCETGEIKLGVFNIGEELRPVADLSIILSIDEIGAQHSI
jgi:hypothetical protein